MPPVPLMPPHIDAAKRMIALLERHCASFPHLDEELARQRSLAELLAEHRLRSEQALSAWRAALSRRWECEVRAQRAYSQAQRLLCDYYSADRAYTQLIAPAHPGYASTANDLLHEVRRLDASLELLTPQPPFAAEAAAELRVAGASLAAAIEQTARCEAERRNALTEQRIAANLYERAYERARSFLARCLGDHTPPLPTAATDGELLV